MTLWQLWKCFLHILGGRGCAALGWCCWNNGLWIFRSHRNSIPTWVSEDTHMTFLNINNTLNSALWKTRGQVLQRSTNTTLGFIFLLKKCSKASVLPNWLYKRILACFPLSLPTLQFDELLPIFQCWDISSSLSHSHFSLDTWKETEFCAPIKTI